MHEAFRGYDALKAQAQPPCNAGKRLGRGFVFSLEAALAVTILISALFLFTSHEQVAATNSQANTVLQDALFELENTGFVVQTIDTNSPTDSATLLRQQLLSLMPDGFDANVTVSSYTVDATNCANQKTFSACFPDANKLVGKSGGAASGDSLSGKSYFLRKQPRGDCNISYISLSEPSQAPRYISIPQKHEALFSEAFFSGNDVNVTFDVNATPSGAVTCDQNITIGLTVSIPEDVRRPIDLMLVIDKSGSMSWDGLLDLSAASDVFATQNYAYVADGSAGLRDINTINPASPNILGTYNSSGTAFGVYVSGSYAYLADGSAGLRVVDVSNPASPNLTGTYNSPGTAYGVYTVGNYAYLADNDQGLGVVNVANKSNPVSAGVITNIGNVKQVFVSGNYAYAVTTSAGSANIQDFNIFGAGNTDLNIGRTGANNNTAAQSFIPSSNTIRSVDVYIKKISIPGNITVALRQALGGANIASATISANSVNASYGWVNADFGSDISLTAGQTYYLVISKSGSASATKYYQWQGLNTNPYSGGNAYQQSSSIANTDAFIITYHMAQQGLQIIDVSNAASPAHKSSFAGTAPNDVFVSGNYAYFADGSAGLKIIDITSKTAPSQAGSYNTPGTASDVEVYSDGNAYVADSSSLQVINVSTPTNPVFVKSYATPYSYTGLDISDSWAFLVPGISTGLTTFNIYTGPKMGQAKLAAQSFVDFNEWQLPPDQMGLVSFNSAATLDKNLTSNSILVNNAISALSSSGSTDMSAGITSATNELNSARHNSKALKFQVLLSDGVSQTDPTSAANTAHNNSITIYTIGFGGDADAGQLSSIASITGGQYYAASDANALQAVFALIALKVAELANDANVSVPIMTGSTITSDGNGTIIDGNLVFTAGDINTANPFTTNYNILFPCANANVCTNDAITFPGPGAKFTYFDSDGNVQSIDFNASLTIPFYSRDLNVSFVSGSVLGKNDVSLDLLVSNIGELDANQTNLRLYLNDTATTPLNTYAVPALCSQQTPGCVDYSKAFSGISIGSEGVIYARVNDANEINECPSGNLKAVNCYGGPETEVYAIEYAVWRP